MKKTIQAILIGAGQRGSEVYGAYALRHPEQLQFVAVAEPNTKRRERFANQHAISTANQFTSWEPLLERASLGQAAFVCTQDQQHTAPALGTDRTDDGFPRRLRSGHRFCLRRNPVAARHDRADKGRPDAFRPPCLLARRRRR